MAAERVSLRFLTVIDRFETLKELPEYLRVSGQTVADAVSQASPMWMDREFGGQVAGKATSLWNLFSGTIGGVVATPGGERIVSAGSIGTGGTIENVTCAFPSARIRAWDQPWAAIAGAPTFRYRHNPGGLPFPGRPAVTRSMRPSASISAQAP